MFHPEVEYMLWLNYILGSDFIFLCLGMYDKEYETKGNKILNQG